MTSRPIVLTTSLDDFRLAMRKLAASVHIVTTQHGGVRGGLTATAVCSVSFDPMTMLVCVHRDASCFDLIEKSRKLAINALSAQQTDLAMQFGSSKHMHERFQSGNWETLDDLPVLSDAAAVITLDIASHHDNGSHRVYFGTVVEVRRSNALKSLLYEDGAFVQSTPLR